MWDKLDEIVLGTIGATTLGVLGYTAITLGFDGGTAQICVTGVVAIVTAALGMKAGQMRGGNGSTGA